MGAPKVTDRPEVKEWIDRAHGYAVATTYGTCLSGELAHEISERLDMRSALREKKAAEEVLWLRATLPDAPIVSSKPSVLIGEPLPQDDDQR